MSEEHLPYIECHGSARQMGQQYGEQAADDIRNNVAAFGVEDEDEETRIFAQKTIKVLERHLPDVLEELRGLSEGSGQSLSALLRLNQVNTFTVPRPSPGCTSMALSQGEDGPVLGKNNDGSPDARRFIIRKTTPASGHRMIQVTYTGWVSGLDAMNSAGLVNGHNSVGSKFDKSGERVDIRLWMYALMRQSDGVADLLTRLDCVPLTGKGFNVVLVDRSGDTCVLEAAVPLVSVRSRGEAFVYATNHYASNTLSDADRRTPDQKPVTIYRYGYLLWRDAFQRPRHSRDLVDILQSHEPWAPCRHGGAHLSHTLWSMVGLPADQHLRVASGPPCSHAYLDYPV